MNNGVASLLHRLPYIPAPFPATPYGLLTGLGPIPGTAVGLLRSGGLPGLIPTRPTGLGVVIPNGAAFPRGLRLLVVLGSFLSSSTNPRTSLSTSPSMSESTANIYWVLFVALANSFFRSACPANKPSSCSGSNSFNASSISSPKCISLLNFWIAATLLTVLFLRMRSCASAISCACSSSLTAASASSSPAPSSASPSPASSIASSSASSW
mmetsp:Transcript_50843/g.79506  ORF Transcript_50843/g.79506 Transcript_50843/m.79506 type:complete len:211 (-) Transcript_50843:514-1146(-)